MPIKLVLTPKGSRKVFNVVLLVSVMGFFPLYGANSQQKFSEGNFQEAQDRIFLPDFYKNETILHEQYLKTVAG